MERLCALVPPPRKHLVTYHGVLAPASGLRPKVVPRQTAAGEEDAAGAAAGCRHGAGGGGVGQVVGADNAATTATSAAAAVHRQQAERRARAHLRAETVEVDLPSAANGGKTIQGPVMITMDKDAKIFFDGVEVASDALMAKMKDAVAKDKEVRAIISADQTLNYGKVMTLIDQVKEAGISKFALNIQKEAKAAAPAP